MEDSKVKSVIQDVYVLSKTTQIVVYNNTNNNTMSLDEYIDNYKTQTNATTAGMNGVVITNEMYSNVNNSIIQHKVTYDGYIGKQADYLNIKNTLEASTSRFGSFSTLATNYQNIRYKQSTSTTITASTYFWRGYYSAIIYEGSSSVGFKTGYTSTILYNRGAVPYFSYTDAHSGIRLTEPNFSNMNAVPTHLRVDWTNNDRRDYIVWYVTNYGKPAFNWEDYDIHHIIPREYGGTNSPYNLIPLPRQYHQLFHTSFWRLY
ncbi:HNH endonuclease signature motif containing protein [Paenibacillus sp. FJAT-26967]|uniref:HNH endonuclease signature motif containing protein n=1 Tax=Paenibacillus sp. FJAT-26967 TaxID=1729690 RepID=UPI000A8641A6|nr:HNH endonuclease signature motif containing protein [Paenibacillus sp. FJAT-26967]